MSMKKAQGFTLVETLVAIAILLIVITIPYYAIERALIASYISRDQLIAASLAEEGLEFTESIRDANAISKYQSSTNYSWMGNLDGTRGDADFISTGGSGFANCQSPNACALDPGAMKVVQCTNSTCSTYPLYQITAAGVTNGEYTLTSTSNTLTRFTRYVQIQATSANEEKVTVTVYWTTEQASFHVTVSKYFENWQ